MPRRTCGRVSVGSRSSPINKTRIERTMRECRLGKIHQAIIRNPIILDQLINRSGHFEICKDFDFLFKMGSGIVENIA